MRALGKLNARPEQLRQFLPSVPMLEDGQREGRLGDEEIARDDLVRRAGGVGAALVVARNRHSAPFPLDHHLCAAEHMARRHELQNHLADVQRLPIGCSLSAEAGRAAKSRFHESKRLPRGEHMIMPAAGVVGVGVSDHCPVDLTAWIDMEAARPAEQAVIIDCEPGLELISFHGTHV